MIKKVSVVLTLIGVIMAIGATTLYIYFPKLVHSKLQQELPLRPNAPNTARWSSIDVPLYMRFYLFEVVNPDDVEYNQSRAILRERGPYTFHEKIRKEIVNFSPDGKLLTYKVYKTFKFDREKSVGSLDDEIVHINVPLVAIVNGAKKEAETEPLGDLLLDTISSLIDHMEQTLFVKHRVGQLLFEGYKVPILEKLKEVASEFGMEMDEKKGLPNNTFGLFYGKNNTDDGIWTINTGLDDINKYLTVHTWNFSNKVDYWSDHCNQINGTDGSSFPPGLSKDKPLYAFSPDLCRSLPIEYEEETEVHGIKTYRFGASARTFRSGTREPNNKCFCQRPPDKREVCEIDGILDLQSCRNGAPVSVSGAHFFQGQESLHYNVLGLDPTKEKHGSFLDIEPTTGIPLRAARRLQMNIQIEQDSKIPVVSEIRNMILPIAWIQESVTIPEHLAEELRSKLGTLKTGKVVMVSSIVLGLLVILVGILLFVYNSKSESKRKATHSSDSLKKAPLPSTPSLGAPDEKGAYISIAQDSNQNINTVNEPENT